LNYPKPFKRKGSSSFFFNYVDPLTGKRKLKSTGSSKVGESKEFIQTFMDRLTPAGIITFREYAEKFLSSETNPRYIRYRMAGKQYSKNHINSQKYTLRKHIFPRHFADMEMTSITRGDILDLLMQLNKDLKAHPATINNIIKYISAIFSEAYYREDIKYNPAQRLTKVKYKSKKIRGTLTPDEIKELFSDPDKWKSKQAYQVFLFAAYTGRRKGEIMGLQWSQIKDGYCIINQAYNRGEKGLAPPKWEKCVTIPLCKTVLDNLPERGESPYVFSTEEGGKCYARWWQEAFDNDVRPRYSDRYIVAHSFRHSLNTNLVLAMIPELYVKKYIGWTDRDKDTQASYTHIKPEHLKFIADKIDEIYCLDDGPTSTA